LLNFLDPDLRRGDDKLNYARFWMNTNLAKSGEYLYSAGPSCVE
jgi:hypothetical protein